MKLSRTLSSLRMLCWVLSVAGKVSAADSPAGMVDGYPRTVLIEEFVGAKCGWRTECADTLEEITGSNEDVIALAYHINDELETEAGRALNDFFRPGYPHALFDRSPVPDSPGFPISRRGWKTAVTNRANVSSPLSLESMCSYDAAAGEVSLRIVCCLAEAVPYPCRLHIVVAEDSIPAPRKGYKQSERILDPYYHMHVVRDVITGPYGEPISFADAEANVCVMQRYSFPLKNVSRPDQCSIVIFLTEGPDKVFGTVIQATKVRLISEE